MSDKSEISFENMKVNTKTWKSFQEEFLEQEQPILCPVTVEMIVDKKKGSGEFFEFKMLRMTSGQLGKLEGKILNNVPFNKKEEIKEIIAHYRDEFKDDGDESAVAASPLDFYQIKRSVIYLVYLNNDNWTFSGHKQFNCLNDDENNPTVRQITTFDGQRGLLVDKSKLVDHRLKYDFYVTVHQRDGKATDIIIDPRDDDGSTGG